jgi:hypothetical protein
MPPPDLNGPSNPAVPGPLKDEFIRRMNHGEWLSQFAVTLEVSQKDRPVPMTPFRAGAISRLRFAAAYIDLLEREARDYVREIEVLKHENEILNPKEGR